MYDPTDEDMIEEGRGIREDEAADVGAERRRARGPEYEQESPEDVCVHCGRSPAPVLRADGFEECDECHVAILERNAARMRERAP